MPGVLRHFVTILYDQDQTHNMRLSHVFLHFLAAVSAVSARQKPRLQALERDVAIIGGGASGTFAAVRLAGQGRSVALIEREDHLGGHTVTYKDPDTGIPLNMGVIFYHDLPVVRDFFSHLGVEVRKAALTSGSVQYFDFSTGRAVPGFEPADPVALGTALQKYLQILATRYPNISLAYDLPDPIPDELLKPYSEFIDANGLQPIVQLANTVAGANGNLWERPALYGIKALSPMLIQAVNNGFVNAASGDNLDLYRGAEKLLGDNVFLSSTVTRVERNHKGVKVLVDTPDGQVIIKTKKLLVAIPPIRESLQDIGLDVTTNESRLFSQFKAFPYSAAVLTHSGTNENTILTNVGTDTPYHLLNLPGSYSYNTEPGTNKVKVFIGGVESDIGFSEEEIKELITGELNNLAGAGNIGEGMPEFKFFVKHSPFHVHVSSEAIGKGFYKKLYELEGLTNTFWTGATFVDEDSSLIWAWSEEYLVPQILESLSE